MQKDQTEESRLVAYIGGGEMPPVQSMRDILADKVPAHMVPSAFVSLEAIPLTPNGKINYAALPPPVFRRSTKEFVGARDSLELELAGFFKEILGVPVVGIVDSFFDLGGH